MALRTSSMLARWAQFSPGTRMPDDIKELPLTQQAALSNADPELHALLGNTANAELELAAMSGTFSDSYTAPSADQLRAARVQEILAQNPGGTLGHYDEAGNYVEGKPANMSLMLELSSLDQTAWQQQEMIRKPPAPVPGALTAEEAARVNARVAAARAESLNHGNTLVDQGDY